MAEGCCLRIVSYFMAIQNLLAGAILITTLQFLEGGICMCLGCFLIFALCRGQALCLLVYVFLHGLTLLVATSFCIVGLFQVDLDNEKYNSYIFYIAAFIPTFLLLVLVFLHYRELAQDRAAQTVSSGETSTILAEEKSVSEIL